MVSRIFILLCGMIPLGGCAAVEPSVTEDAVIRAVAQRWCPLVPLGVYPGDQVAKVEVHNDESLGLFIAFWDPRSPGLQAPPMYRLAHVESDWYIVGTPRLLSRNHESLFEVQFVPARECSEVDWVRSVPPWFRASVLDSATEYLREIAPLSAPDLLTCEIVHGQTDVYAWDQSGQVLLHGIIDLASSRSADLDWQPIECKTLECNIMRMRIIDSLKQCVTEP
jgi:hypothetical protein